MPRVALDRLRLLGMGAVFLIHTALPFNPWAPWHVLNAERSQALGAMLLVLAPWVMPLFMFLAGTGSWHSLEHHRPSDFIARRLRRLGLPLLVGIPVLVPPQVWVSQRMRGRFDGSLAEFYPHFLEGWYPNGNFALLHLWFVAFLLAVGVITLPLIVRMRSAGAHAALERWSLRAARPAGLLWLVLPVVMVRMAVWYALPGVRFIADDWPGRVLLPLAYCFGAAAAASPGLQRALVRQCVPAAVVAATAIAVLMAVALGTDLPAHPPAPRSWRGAGLWALYAAASWSALIALVGMASRHWARAGARVQRTTEGVYPFYLVHQTAIVLIAGGIVGLRAGALPKFVLLGAAAAAVSLAVTALVVRVRPLRLLVGLRRERPAAEVA
jgi:glucans biosynthesis protein C